MAKEIKKISSVTILFITSQIQDDIIQDAIKTEPVVYLTKPVDPAELKANIGTSYDCCTEKSVNLGTTLFPSGTIISW